MKVIRFFLLALSTLLITTTAIAQTPSRLPPPQAKSSPSPAPSSTLSQPQQKEVEKIVDERFEKSSKVSDRIQSTVNSNFSWAIGLLTALIAVLGVMPIVTVIIVWLLRGRYEAALDAFDQAIKLDPTKRYGWRNRGYVLTKLQRYNEASASFEEALKIDPTSSGTYYWRAYWCLVQNMPLDAIDHLSKAIHLSEAHRKAIKTDPDFDALRGDDRFKQLMSESSQES